jgi:predicted acetyltransferase
VKIEIIPVVEEEKQILSHLIELYEYDFSEYGDSDVNKLGLYGYSYLDYYWTEERRHPYFIVVDGNLAGFVLVCDYCYVLKNSNANLIAEFFVMKKYRKHGVGSYAAKYIFDLFKGSWELTINPYNPISQKFWTKVISEYTKNKYEIHKDIEGVYDDCLATAYTFDITNED